MDRNRIAQRLLERAKELGALRFGEFTLSSGQKSSYYFDGRLLSLDPEGADLISAAFLDIVRRAGAEAVGGPAVAAVPIVGALVLRSRLESPAIGRPYQVVPTPLAGDGSPPQLGAGEGSARRSERRPYQDVPSPLAGEGQGEGSAESRPGGSGRPYQAGAGGTAPKAGLIGFFVRAEAKKHGAGKQIEGPVKPGMKVAVFDDTVSTGGSLIAALDAIQEHGCTVVTVCCVLDRRQGGSDEVRRRGLPFTALWQADAEGNVRVATG